MQAYICVLTRSNNGELTGLRQMNPRLTRSCRRSRHVRLQWRFADVDVVDIVLRACGTELAAMALDAVPHAADARRDDDDDDDGGGDHDDHHYNGHHRVQWPTPTELHWTDSERQSSHTYLTTTHIHAARTTDKLYTSKTLQRKMQDQIWKCVTKDLKNKNTFIFPGNWGPRNVYVQVAYHHLVLQSKIWIMWITI